MSKKIIIASIGGAIFILLNCIAIKFEFFFVPFFSVVAVALYLMVFRFDRLMYLMAFVTPLSVEIADTKYNIGVSLPAEIIMILLTMLFFVRLLYDIRLERRIIFHPISILIYLYLTWMFITSITSEIPLVSFKYWASQLWFIIACYFMVILLIKNDLKKAITYINCYAIALGIVIIIATTKFALTGFVAKGQHWIMSPFYNDHTAYGAAIAFFIPLILALFITDSTSKWKKIYYLLLMAVSLIGLFFSYCRAAWLSIIVAFSVWVVIKLRIKFSWLVVGVSILFSTLYYFSDDIIYKMGKNTQDSSGEFVEHITSVSNITTDASNVERLNRWWAAFGMIEDRPIAGWGPGTYQFVYAGYQKGKYKTIITTNFGDGGNAHSEFIGPCAEMGFPGAILVLILMITAIYIGITTYNRTSDKIPKQLSLYATLALISYYVHGVMNNFLDTEKLSLPFWAAMAVIVAADISNKKVEMMKLKTLNKKNDDYNEPITSIH
jgi:O-antigen ligase